jgi:hypothetical protein
VFTFRTIVGLAFNKNDVFPYFSFDDIVFKNYGTTANTISHVKNNVFRLYGSDGWSGLNSPNWAFNDMTVNSLTDLGGAATSFFVIHSTGDEPSIGDMNTDFDADNVFNANDPNAPFFKFCPKDGNAPTNYIQD